MTGVVSTDHTLLGCATTAVQRRIPTLADRTTKIPPVGLDHGGPTPPGGILLTGDTRRLSKDFELSFKYHREYIASMELPPRLVAFVHDEMERVENAEDRYPSERADAEAVREQTETILTE